MAKYYSVQVAIEVEDAKGKIKKQREQYLVDALSVTEAEAKLVQKKLIIGLVIFLHNQKVHKYYANNV